MAWFWPDSRVRKWFDVEGLDNLKRAQMQNRGVMVVGVHFTYATVGPEPRHAGFYQRHAE
ncbi:hypothetical protein [Escherichia coli]